MNKEYLKILDSAIHEFMVINAKEPNHIVINPNTYQYLVSEMGINDEYRNYIHDLTTNNRFRGYRIFRSFDVEESEFTIG